ncbi:MAG: hypothetical protein ABI877_08065 [Gemmatimonadaceae bacterium]
MSKLPLRISGVALACIVLAGACATQAPLTVSVTRHGVALPFGATPKPIELEPIDTVQFAVRANAAPGLIRQLSLWRVDASGNEKGVASKPRLLVTVDQPVRTENGVAAWEAFYTLDVRESLGNEHFFDTIFRGRLDYVDGRSLQLEGTRFVARVTQVNLHIVAMQNDDGSMAAQVQLGDFPTLLARTNRSFRSTGIQLALDPADFETFRRTALNREQTGWTIIADSIASTHPTRVVGILRWGSGTSFTGNANAYPPPGASPRHPAVTDVDQKFVMLEDFLDLTQNGYLNLLWGSHLAHEFGHYLGLYHTFVGWEDWNPVYTSAPATRTPAQVQQALLDFLSPYGGTASALDGDQLSDTPPDPSGPLYGALGLSPCTTNTIAASGMIGGVAATISFSPSTSNVMSYMPQCGVEPDGTGTPLVFTAQQVGVMHHVISTVPSRKLVVSRVPVVPVP